jgi:hypothetical protein
MQPSDTRVQDILEPVSEIKDLVIKETSKDLTNYLRDTNSGFYSNSDSTDHKTKPLKTCKNMIRDDRIRKYRHWHPREMEKLQNLPANWLVVDGKDTPQSASQKLCGNAMTCGIIELLIRYMPHFAPFATPTPITTAVVAPTATVATTTTTTTGVAPTAGTAAVAPPPKKKHKVASSTTTTATVTEQQVEAACAAEDSKMVAGLSAAAVQKSNDEYGRNITAIIAKELVFKVKKNDIPTWCYWGLDKTANKWVQLRASNLFGITRTDHQGITTLVTKLGKARQGTRVNFGTGARLTKDEVCSCASVGVSPQASETHSKSPRQCVSDAMKLLLSPEEFQLIHQPSPDLLLTALLRIFSNSKETKLIKPSKWGILSDFSNFKGAIEDLCKGAKPCDKFIIRVYLPPPNDTDLHCVAVRDCQMCDTATDNGWLPLTPASFDVLGISKIVTGFKIS